MTTYRLDRGLFFDIFIFLLDNSKYKKYKIVGFAKLMEGYDRKETYYNVSYFLRVTF